MWDSQYCGVLQASEGGIWGVSEFGVAWDSGSIASRREFKAAWLDIGESMCKKDCLHDIASEPAVYIIRLSVVPY